MDVVTSFLFPFRLVSAYEDKILFRPRAKKCSFPRFAGRILTALGNCSDVLRRCTLNHHWMPYLQNCAYCSVGYGAIGKTENFSADLAAVLRLAKLGGAASRVNSSLRANATPRRENKTMFYFSQLTREARLGLFRLYQLDFEMFDYSALEYLW